MAASNFNQSGHQFDIKNHLRRTSEIVLSIVLLLNVMESVRKHKLGSCSMLLLKWKFQITAFEVMLAQAGKALVLEHLGSGTGERNGHQLALHIQVPATPERVDATIAIDGIAVQSEALQVVQPIESVHRQLGQLVVVHDPGRREGQCRKLVEGHPKRKGNRTINDLQAIQTRQVVKEPGGQLPNVIVFQETVEGAGGGC